MTGYYLEIGYNSAAGARDKLWPNLKAVALGLCGQASRIAQEVLRLEPSLDGSLVADYSESYRSRDDLTIRFIETAGPHEDPSEFRPYIVQLASGGGDAREIKEACRRAFCRLVIEAMHKERIEINLRVS